MPTVHLAGNRVVIGNSVVQRCLICGDCLTKIEDVSQTAVPAGCSPEVGAWPVGSWVEHDGNRMSVVGETQSPEFGREEMPTNCCVDLIEW